MVCCWCEELLTGARILAGTANIRLCLLSSQPGWLVFGVWCSFQEISARVVKEETPRLLLLRFLRGSEGKMTVLLVKPQTGQAVEQQGVMREEGGGGRKDEECFLWGERVSQEMRV